MCQWVATVGTQAPDGLRLMMCSGHSAQVFPSRRCNQTPCLSLKATQWQQKLSPLTRWVYRPTRLHVAGIWLVWDTPGCSLSGTPAIALWCPDAESVTQSKILCSSTLGWDPTWLYPETTFPSDSPWIHAENPVSHFCICLDLPLQDPSTRTCWKQSRIKSNGVQLSIEINISGYKALFPNITFELHKKNEWKCIFCKISQFSIHPEMIYSEISKVFIMNCHIVRQVFTFQQVGWWEWEFSIKCE